LPFLTDAGTMFLLKITKIWSFFLSLHCATHKQGPVWQHDSLKEKGLCIIALKETKIILRHEKTYNKLNT